MKKNNLNQLVEKYHRQLPERIRKWLKERRLSDEIINRFKVGWNGKTITIPIYNKDRDFVFFKFRKDPEDTSDAPKYWYSEGASAELYGWEHIRNSKPHLVICEGELDRLILETYGIPAITGTGGAGTFKNEWTQILNQISSEIFICYDNDDTGLDSAQRIAKLIPKAKIVQIPKLDGIKDITEFIIKKGIEEFNKLLDEAKVLPEIEEENRELLEKLERCTRYASLSPPQEKLSIDKWRETIEKIFPDLSFPAEVGLSVVTQLLIKDISNPFGLVYVDVPSSGKTIILNFFAGIKELVYATDNFTPSSFVSHAVNVKKKDLEKIDLLPKIRYKVLLVRDLAPIFGEREEDLQRNMSLLTRIFDGEGLETESGVHGKRGYQGDYLFMFLAGSTPISPKVWKMIGNFGSRLLFLNMDSKEKDEETLSEQISSDVTLKEKEKICRKATQNLIKTIWHHHPAGVEWDRSKDLEELKKIIGRSAKLLSRLRGVINVWKEHPDDEKYDYTIPIIERPDRINQLLYNLARGHALICGRQIINEEDIALIIEVALDSAPPTRVKFFNILLENKGALTTDEITRRLHCSEPTAHKEMETLKILDLVELEYEDDRYVGRPKKIIKLKEEFKWFLSDECKNLRQFRHRDKFT